MILDARVWVLVYLIRYTVAMVATRLQGVLRSAAKLQELVPDAVLVGDSAAAYYAGHRHSFDHDHVLTDLSDRYAKVVEAVEASEGWATSVRASSPPLTLLGSLDGVEAGLRQLRRSKPLEVQLVEVEGHGLCVPTPEECLRVKSYLIVQRNQVRDYLDTVALTDFLGIEAAAKTVADIDAYYPDRSNTGDSVITILLQRLSEPNPRDVTVTEQLAEYKGIVPKWHDWQAVVEACAELADAVVARMRDTR